MQQSQIFVKHINILGSSFKMSKTVNSLLLWISNTYFRVHKSLSLNSRLILIQSTFEQPIYSR
jgi:hypothetical protein